MKNDIYELVVDVWRLASKYEFRKMTDSDWETFVCNGNCLIVRYRNKGSQMERLCRDLLAAFQEFYQQKGNEK